jgi:hypothetical protein
VNQFGQPLGRPSLRRRSRLAVAVGHLAALLDGGECVADGMDQVGLVNRPTRRDAAHKRHLNRPCADR